MKEIKVYVWWSSGSGDGDGYDDTIEITDKQYAILKEIEVDALNKVKDERIASDCQKWYDEIINSLIENSKDGEFENYRYDCLIDSDDDDGDENEEEQYSMSFEEWWRETYNYGVKISKV